MSILKIGFDSRIFKKDLYHDIRNFEKYVKVLISGLVVTAL